MAGDLDRINEIFRIHDEQTAKAGSDEDKSTDEQPVEKPKATRSRRDPIKAVDKLLIDESGEEASNYTGDEESE